MEHPADQQRHAAIVTLVEQLTAGYATLRGLTLPRPTCGTWSSIDALAYTLYGLMNAEIAHLTLPAG